MSEIICPHCGSPNSIEALNCKSCHKSLYEEPSHPFQYSPDDEMERLKEYRSFGGFEDSSIEDESGAGSGEDTDSTDETHQGDETKSESEPEIPEWLARIRARTREEIPPPAPEPSTPEEPPKYKVGDPISTGFLRDLKASEERSEPEETRESYPAWLKRISDRNLSAKKDEEGIEPAPFNLSDLAGKSEPVIPPEDTPSPFLGTDEPVDFLAQDQESSGIDQESLDSDLDSRFDFLGDRQPFSSPEENEPAADLPENEVPKELEGLPSFLLEDLPEETAEKAEMPDEFEVMPDLDWLNQPLETTTEPETPEEDSLEDLDWLKLKGGEFSEQPTVPERDDSSSPDALPEWLFGRQESTSEDDISTELFGSASPPGGEISGEETPISEDESTPDWLIGIEEPTAPGEPHLEPAASMEEEAFPEWLEEIQTAEAAAPERVVDSEEVDIELSGPLAGYQGVLPGKDAVMHYTKPPLYTSTLQVTEKQRIYSTLFDTMIAEEKKVDEKAAGKTSVPPQILRLIVGILMIGLVIIALLFNANAAVLPALYPAENVAFYNSIQSLSSLDSISSILVGLDYEAGLSGEVGTAATAVMQDLMAGNANLVFVSVNPTGPALASDLVTRANQAVPEYSAAEHVVNLGYLPGGATALAGFAASPPRAAPVTADGKSTWNSESLQDIDSIDDFSAVLLLTDNTDNARAWIEQIDTAAHETPFLLVSSAQAAPALQPYVQSGQLTGMISGLNGAAAYQQLSQNPSDRLSGYWDAYQFGMLLIAVLMILGAVYYSIKYLVVKLKKA